MSVTEAPYFSVPFEHTGAASLNEQVAPQYGFKGATLTYEP